MSSSASTEDNGVPYAHDDRTTSEMIEGVGEGPHQTTNMAPECYPKELDPEDLKSDGVGVEQFQATGTAGVFSTSSSSSSSNNGDHNDVGHSDDRNGAQHSNVGVPEIPSSNANENQSETLIGEESGADASGQPSLCSSETQGSSVWADRRNTLSL